jgi:hypothetical protein
VRVLKSTPVGFRNRSDGSVSGGEVKSFNRKNDAVLAMSEHRMGVDDGRWLSRWRGGRAGGGRRA